MRLLLVFYKNICDLYPNRPGWGFVGRELKSVVILSYYLKVLHSSKAGQKNIERIETIL
ncbi:hypothetical protein AGMMS49573_06370 [Endomicrobiia bacterium]|nr:hypothetical protein AGMMS49573_06370 [Endomicrobiia bacterium]